MRLVPALLLALATLGAACSRSADADVPVLATATGAGPDSAAVPAGPAPPDSVAALDPVTAATYDQILAAAAEQGVASRPYGEIVQWVGEQLLGRPYVAGLLDAPARETLLADLTRFDCVLYIENVLAVARAVALGETSSEAYVDEVRRLRYRGGEMDGYCSRLHYFSEWIADNEARGALRNVTAEAGGVPFDKRITFMTEHRSAYPHLADDATFACAAAAEGRLAGLELVYIPKADIAGAYGSFQPGDVVAMVTSIAGLDVTHTGFVHVADGRTGFLHASSASNEVKVSPDLHDYVQGIRSQVGIVVARPVDPRPAGDRPASAD
ncbi:MAG TPA: N-acetylmuramoyl-L-alanine amidase-like domain-containing protein [Rubricoccaceae bacterium]|jgi:hypothetical protein